MASVRTLTPPGGGGVSPSVGTRPQPVQQTAPLVEPEAD